MKDNNVLKIVFRTFLIVVGALLMADTVALYIFAVGAFSLGKIMPIIIGTPMVIVGVLYNVFGKLFARNRKLKIIGAILKWGMFGCYAAFTALLCVTTVLTLTASRKESPKNADILIVLGGGINQENASLTLANRLDTAIEYMNANTDVICIVSGGQGGDEVISEALVMQRYLLAHSINSDRIIVEDASRSTFENFMFSREIIVERFPNGANVVFVTTNFHVYRAELVAKTAGLEADGIGAPGVWYIALNDYMRECAAITQYWLSGKI